MSTDQPPAPATDDGAGAEPIFVGRGLTRVYRERGRTTRALDGVDLTVRRGQRLGIVGESGSGKTTLLRLLTALDRPSAGTLDFEGRSLIRPDRQTLARLRSQVQLVFQDPRSSLDPRMKVAQIVAEPLRSPLLRRAQTLDQPISERVRQVLDEVGLEPDSADRFPHEFSGGQRQRIAIARALAPRPGVLIADEPVSALDVSVRAQVLNLLTDLVDSSALTLVFVSHDLAVVRHLCHDLVVLRHGQVVESGELEQVWNHPQADYTAELIAARPRLPRTEQPRG